MSLFKFFFSIAKLPFTIIGGLLSLPYMLGIFVMKVVGFFIILCLLLLCLSFFSSCNPPDETLPHRSRYEVVPKYKYDLPYDIATISEKDIPRCLSNGPITASFVKTSEKVRTFFENKVSDIDHEKIIKRNEQWVNETLREDFKVIEGTKQSVCQEIADDLVRRNPSLGEVKVYVVRRQDGKAFVNAGTVRGFILFGEELFDLAAKHAGRDGIALVLAHELGHGVVSHDLTAREDTYVRQLTGGFLSESSQNILIGLYQKVLSIPLNDAEESMCDMIAIKILADHPNYDPQNGLKIYNKLFNTDEDKGIDWANSHATYHREPCLLSLVVNNRVQIDY